MRRHAKTHEANQSQAAVSSAMASVSAAVNETGTSVRRAPAPPPSNGGKQLPTFVVEPLASSSTGDANGVDEVLMEWEGGGGSGSGSGSELATVVGSKGSQQQHAADPALRKRRKLVQPLSTSPTFGLDSQQQHRLQPPPSAHSTTLGSAGGAGVATPSGRKQPLDSRVSSASTSANGASPTIATINSATTSASTSVFDYYPDTELGDEDAEGEQEDNNDDDDDTLEQVLNTRRDRIRATTKAKASPIYTSSDDDHDDANGGDAEDLNLDDMTAPPPASTMTPVHLHLQDRSHDPPLRHR